MIQDRRTAILATADATGHKRIALEWFHAAHDALTKDERQAVENIYYALPMPRVRFSDVLRRELLGDC